MSTQSPNDTPVVNDTTMPWIVSVDDHVVEPPDLWSSRLPAKYRDVGPHIEYLPMGHPVLAGGTYIEAPGTEGRPIAWWFYEDHRYSVKRLIAAAGYQPDEIGMQGVTYEPDDMRPGCWQPKARVADMDINHVEASLCFPNYPRFCGQLFLRGKDKELARLCVQAYNDWMVEEWAGESDGRLVPLCLVPLWDVDLAVAEIQRNASRGVRAVAFSECPAWLDLPSIHTGYWDPFVAACEETGTAIAMHIGSGTKTFNTGPDAPEGVQATGIFTNSAMSLIDWLLSGLLVRFPRVKLLYAECQIGWIPYVLERTDDIWETHRGWAHTQDKVHERPSTYYYSNVWSCFFKDSVGTKLLDEVGRDNICFETDFPHQDGTWPHSAHVAEKLFGHLDGDTVHKIIRGNAIRLLQLDLAP